MQDERATEEGQAAIRAAIEILAEARRSNPPQVVAPLPRVSKPRNIRIGHAEFELDRLAFLVVLILVGMYGVMALAYMRTQSLAADENRALALVTTPEAAPVHLVAQGGFAADAQATYWGKPAADVAILTLSNLRPISGGTRYRWWARHGDQLTALAGGTVDGQDNVHLIATGPELASPADAIWVTLEAADADPSLVEGTVLSWSNH